MAWDQGKNRRGGTFFSHDFFLGGVQFLKHRILGGTFLDKLLKKINTSPPLAIINEQSLSQETPSYTRSTRSPCLIGHYLGLKI
jgi:hypothetical protein